MENNLNKNQVVQSVVVVNKSKSVGLAFILAFLFGPIGLFYSSILGGFIMIIFPFVITFIVVRSASNLGGALFGLSSVFFWLIVDWFICLIWAIIASNRSNKNVCINTKMTVENLLGTVSDLNLSTESEKDTIMDKGRLKLSFRGDEKYFYPIIGLFIMVILFYIYSFFINNNENANFDIVSQNNIEEHNETDNELVGKIDEYKNLSETQNSESNIIESELNNGYYIANGSDSSKIFFHNSPNSSSRRKAFLNTVEKVYVVEIENGYGYIEFTNSLGQKSKGWVEMKYLNQSNI